MNILNKQRSWWSWGIGAIPLLLGIFIFLSLVSFSPRDVEYVYPSATSVHNYGGVFGASLGVSLFKWLGKSAYFVAILLISFSVLWVYEQKIFRYIAWSGWTVAILFFLCSIFTFLEKIPYSSDRMPSQGGITGLFVNQTLQDICGALLFKIILAAWGIFLLFQIVLFWMEVVEPEADPFPVSRSFEEDNNEQELA